jgi:hypothetical protein
VDREGLAAVLEVEGAGAQPLVEPALLPGATAVRRDFAIQLAPAGLQALDLSLEAVALLDQVLVVDAGLPPARLAHAWSSPLLGGR